jgi:hypothetical protein
VGADKDILYRTAYEEAARALCEQQGAVDNFRTRAGLLLSAAAIATSFLGGQALDGTRVSPAVWLALAGFVGVAIASLAMLWPRRWELHANPRNVIDTYIETDRPAAIHELHRDLSLHMHASQYENRKGLRQLALYFQVASSLLTVEVALWIFAIASTT